MSYDEVTALDADVFDVLLEELKAEATEPEIPA